MWHGGSSWISGVGTCDIAAPNYCSSKLFFRGTVVFCCLSLFCFVFLRATAALFILNTAVGESWKEMGDRVARLPTRVFVAEMEAYASIIAVLAFLSFLLCLCSAHL